MSEEIQQQNQRTPEEIEAEVAKVKVETKKLEAEVRQAEAVAIKTELEAKTQERGFIIRGAVRFELTR